MDLKTYKVPTNDRTPQDLLQEAKDRGFYDGVETKYNRLFKGLFYRGGRVQFKKDIDEDYKKRAWSYLRQYIQGWSSKHEDKEAVCALILSELCEPELQKEKAQ